MTLTTLLQELPDEELPPHLHSHIMKQTIMRRLRPLFVTLISFLALSLSVNLWYLFEKMEEIGGLRALYDIVYIVRVDMSTVVDMVGFQNGVLPVEAMSIFVVNSILFIYVVFSFMKTRKVYLLKK